MRILTDKFNRVHDYLRISLTDKCNLNCIYCNPSDYTLKKLSKSDILSFDELLRIIDIFAGKLGIRKIRFTGGEPLVRKDILSFFKSVKSLKDKHGFEIGLTTNGTLLENNLENLFNSGVDKLNISLDSLKPDVFKYITGSNGLESVLRSIKSAVDMGFDSLKINTVVMKNINDNEIMDFVELFKDYNITIRFIEFMPFTNNKWKSTSFISSDNIKNIVESKHRLNEISGLKNLVAKEFSIENHKGRVGFISSISNHFCGTCNRLRIDSKGKMKLCLFSSGETELNFKEFLNNSYYSDEAICDAVSEKLQSKPENHPGIEVLAALENNNMLTIGG